MSAMQAVGNRIELRWRLSMVVIKFCRIQMKKDNIPPKNDATLSDVNLWSLSPLLSQWIDRAIIRLKQRP